MESKKELRTLCKKKREAIKNKEEKSAEIVRKILAVPEVQNADALFVFYPLKDEVNLLPVAEYAWRNGKKVGFPLCEDKDGKMTFRLVSSLSELADGHFKTKEPCASAAELLPENAVIFLPALATDKNRFRLGYGKGYYDRYLSKYAKYRPYTVGVVFKDLIFDEIPHDEHDIPCDAIVCDGNGEL